MAIQKVVVVDGNNLIVRIDRGVAGRSVTDVVPIEIDNALYLEFYFSDGTTETVGPVGTIQYIGTSPIVVTGSTISLSTVPVNLGGTGATTASGARTNLGLGSISTQDASSVAITGGSITGITDLAVADGGTGASTASGARTNLGLGTIATQDSSNVSITGGSITGITDLAIADGGTGASTASGARSNLGLGTSATLNAGVANGVATLDSGGTVPLSQIPASIQGGVSYQGAWNASTNTPTLTSSVGTKGYYYVVSVAGNTNLNGITDWVVGDWAIFNGSVWQKIDNTDAVTSVNGYTGTVVLTNTDISGFGTMSTQNANNVSITGGSITGITDLAVADGGTGASTASGARTNLGAAASGANSDITSMSGITGGIATADFVTFDTSYATALTAGQLGWDGNNTLGLGMAGGNVVQRIGEDQFYYIKASSAITKGQVVMFTGSVGASGVVTGAPANGVTDGSYIMGIAAESIAVNGFGLIQFEGTLRGFDTSAFSDGNILWYDPTVVGGLTATQPTAPNVKVQMCAVINAGNAGNGSVLVRVTAGSVLGGTDSNVQFTSLADGNIIQYDATAQYWKNVTPGSVAVTSFSGGSTGLTPATATAGAVTLGGTLGIGYGGTGKTTATDAFNALAPSQTGNSGKYLTTDGTNTSWAANPLGTVTSVSGTGTVNGLTLTGTVTTSGDLTLGGTLSGIANSALTNSSITIGGTSISLGGSSSSLANDITVNGITVGRGAGAVATNTAVGVSALAANTTGSQNAAFGWNAGLNNTGTYITAIGSRALAGNTSGNANTSVGTESLYSNTTASNNTAVGYQAGYSNTTGDQNVAVGKGALFSNSTGASNVALGARTLEASTASYNTGLGFAASFQNTSGVHNLSAGYISLYANTTGSYNVALGSQALQSNTTASNNTAVGYQAGYSNTTASQNTFIGYQAGYSTTTGDLNTFVGYAAGGNVTTGFRNTLIGRSAGGSLTTGNYNTFMGIGSGDIGAGSAITTGSKNTIIGGYGGNQGGLDIRTASNYIVLSDGDGNPRQIIDSSGTAMIGTSAYIGYSGSLHLKSTLAFVSDNTGAAGNRNWAIQQNGSQAGALDFVDSSANNTWPNNAYRVAVTSYGINLGASTNTSGMGITFPATQVPSSNANTLDDYEQGTWTPAVRGSGTAGTYTPTAAVGTYTKIGNMVVACGRINGFSAASGGTGYAQITGLPFQNAESAVCAVRYDYMTVNASTVDVHLEFIGSSGQTTLNFRENYNNSSGLDTPISSITTNTAYIVFTMTYITND